MLLTEPKKPHLQAISFQWNPTKDLRTILSSISNNKVFTITLIWTIIFNIGQKTKLNVKRRVVLIQKELEWGHMFDQVSRKGEWRDAHGGDVGAPQGGKGDIGVGTTLKHHETINGNVKNLSKRIEKEDRECHFYH